MIKSFIWDNKQPLVNKTTAYLPRDMGGLVVPNIQLICSSLNVKTAYRIINSKSENWNAIGKFYLKSEDKRFGMDYFLCTCSSLKGLNVRLKFNAFYEKLLNDWINFRKTVQTFTGDPRSIAENTIFGNCQVTINNKSLFFESFTKSNIIKVGDIWDFKQNACIPDNEIFKKIKFKRNWICEWSLLKKVFQNI